MKFTNGFWLVKKEFSADYVREIYKWDAEKEKLTLFAPYKMISGRGDTLNIGLMTIALSSPMEDIIRVRLTNHAGAIKKDPLFDIPDLNYDGVQITSDADTASITSGKLTLSVHKGRPEILVISQGKLVTKIPAKGLAYMRRNDGHNFLTNEFSLGTGELVYGLGERFTPFVKNGQSIDMWNEDGGTASEIAYKNIPFYMTSENYGIFVNHPGKVSFEVGSEKVESVQFSVEDESIEYYIIRGENQKDVISKYTALTGRPPILPKWSFGLWLTTSFTTNYDEKTVTSFVGGFAKRDIPLHAFHFDCFWMKEFEWCNFSWDKDMFPEPEEMLKRLHKKGLHICVWINPYIAQKSPLFTEAAEKGYLLKNADGTVWQWDMWQAGMGIVDFTNPSAYEWYQSKLKKLADMGVDCFKTDFGERIPSHKDGYNIAWYDGSDDEKMHNYYTYLYNKCVFELLEFQKGKGNAVLFARSATTGGQKFPIHWGGDSTSQYVSMAESLRAGLSLMDSGFSFWSHDIGGFEDQGPADLYKRWCAFGLFSSHSRLHGSSSYRVPWTYDDEACDVLRFFVKLKCRLMPYIYSKAIYAHLTGIPLMRPMHLEFPLDKNCRYLDAEYMFGPSILVAPVFSQDGRGDCYLPELESPQDTWTHLLSGKQVASGKWFTDSYDFFSMPVFVKAGTALPTGKEENTPDYDYIKETVWQVFPLYREGVYKGEILNSDGKADSTLEVKESISSDVKEAVLEFDLTKCKGTNSILVRNFKAEQNLGNDSSFTLEQKGSDCLISDIGQITVKICSVIGG